MRVTTIYDLRCGQLRIVTDHDNPHVERVEVHADGYRKTVDEMICERRHLIEKRDEFSRQAAELQAEITRMREDASMRAASLVVDEDAEPRRQELRDELKAAREALARASSACADHAHGAGWQRWASENDASDRLQRAKDAMIVHVHWHGGDIDKELSGQ